MLWVILFSLDSLFVGFSLIPVSRPDWQRVLKPPSHMSTTWASRGTSERRTAGAIPAGATPTGAVSEVEASWHRSAQGIGTLMVPLSVGRSRPSRKKGRTSAAAVQPRSNVPRRDWKSIGTYISLNLPCSPSLRVHCSTIRSHYTTLTLPPCSGADRRVEKPRRVEALRLDYTQFYYSFNYFIE